jgi:aminoglycoside phosphotransferase (APT) family kinase protein
MAAPVQANAAWDWAALARVIAGQIGAKDVAIADVRSMLGGAVQAVFRMTLDVTGGPLAGRQPVVLRANLGDGLGYGVDRQTEAQIIAAAISVGIPVPPVLAASNDGAGLGKPWIIQPLVAGDSRGRSIVRAPDLVTLGPRLAAELGGYLARIHTIKSGDARVASLPAPLRPPVETEIARLRAALDAGCEPRPALEYILGWLLAHAPAPRPTVLLHGDYRTGNYIVADGRVAAVIDWELAHWGDPREDIGWFISRSWRFGNDDKVAGGLAKFAVFLDAYNAVASEPIGASEVVYWEIYAAARWATLAAMQGARAATAGSRGLELALTGLMVPEVELDALLGIEAFEKGRK